MIVNTIEGITVKPASSSTVILYEGELGPGNTGIAFSVGDSNKTYKGLKAKGVEFTKQPVDEGFGPYALFEDPDGNEFWPMSINR